MDRAKILVVDDESRMRKLVRDFLVREGYNVLEAEDGVEAMDIFYEEKDIAPVIAFLAGPDSCYYSGQSVIVDGANSIMP